MDLEIPSSVSSSGTKGMKRASKLFIKVDKEGLLTDTVSISDVVNFDCYESIVSSAQRIIASFVSTKPDQILINSIFYYKRRARSNRMNPAQIWSTTDGFRAIAEHPSGEVPVGVYWSQKFRAPSSGKAPVRRHAQVELDRAALAELRKSSSPGPDAAESGIPEKRRRIETAPYKTYMPTDDVVEEDGDVKPTINNGVHPTNPPSPPAPTPPSGQVPPQVIRINLGSEPSFKRAPPFKPCVPECEDDGSGKDSSGRYPYKSQYQWPEHVKCEVVLTYDGITERRQLNSNLSYVVQTLLKGNYSVLNREIASSFTSNRSGVTGVSGTKSPQETLEQLMNPEVGSRMPPHKPTSKVPIRYLQDAQSEIFKILSVLKLSKARFKQLLKWMKSLKLEEGKQGKFYLSERNTIGSGLRVTYDTDEQAAIKLNHIYKTRSHSSVPKVMHSIDSMSTAPQGSSDTNYKLTDNNQFMLLMPQGHAVQTADRSEASGIAGNLPLLAEVLAGNTTKRYNSASKISRPDTDAGKSPSPAHSFETVVDMPEKTVHTKTVPAIMRRKQKTPTQKPRAASPPVPMHLYRNYPVEESSSETFSEEVALDYIKQEPEDYSETGTGSSTEDFHHLSPAPPVPGVEQDQDMSSGESELESDGVANPTEEATDQNMSAFACVKTEPVDWTEPEYNVDEPVNAEDSINALDSEIDVSAFEPQSNVNTLEETPSSMNKLKASGPKRKTDSQTRWAVSTLKAWMRDNGYPDDNSYFETLELSGLDEMLQQFYTSLQSKDKQMYSKPTLISIRASINRWLTQPPFSRQLNLSRDREFTSSNEVFSGLLKTMQKEGLYVCKHKEPISEEDNTKLYSSGVFAETSPLTLQCKVFYEIVAHFGPRGRDGLIELKKDSFEISQDSKGRRFVRLSGDEADRVYQGRNSNDKPQEPRLYETGGKYCPFRSFTLYLSKLNPGSDYFFQRPVRRVKKNANKWYESSAVGINKLNSYMPYLSEEASLSQRYTNNCIRTAIGSRLLRKGISSESILTVTGQRSRIGYPGNVNASDDERYNISNALVYDPQT